MPAADAQLAALPEQTRLRISVDGEPYDVVAGSTLLAALDELGVLMKDVEIPHYCWHPKLAIDGSCRLCQVEVEGFPKLQTACSLPVQEGMVVRTRGERVEQARKGVMELLLVNHPLDCPICDQAGECGLQQFAWRYGSPESRSREPRRALDKRVDLGPTILLDRERCILCRRCVRFCREVTETGELGVFGRGDRSVIDCFPGARLDNPYSMNVADICPVGALTTKDFRFAVRVWDLKSAEGVCGGCARGCNIQLDVAHGEVKRYRPRRNDFVNGSWICDAGRLSYATIARADRIRSAQLRVPGRGLEPRPLAEVIEAAAARLSALVAAKGAGVIAGIASAHATNEDLFTFRRFLAALGTDSAAVIVPQGEADSLLVHREKAGNAAGARALGFSEAEGSIERIRRGGMDGAVIMGSDLLGRIDSQLLERLDTVVLIDTHQSVLLRVAHAVFPARHLAEKDGTLTNCEGRVQRVRRALEPPFAAVAEGEVVHRLGVALGLQGFEGEYDALAASLELSRALAPFAGTDFDALPASGRLLGERAKGADA